MELTFKCKCGVEETKIFEDGEMFDLINFKLMGSSGEGAKAYIECSNCQNSVWGEDQ